MQRNKTEWSRLLKICSTYLSWYVNIKKKMWYDCQWDNYPQKTKMTQTQTLTTIGHRTAFNNEQSPCKACLHPSPFNVCLLLLIVSLLIKTLDQGINTWITLTGIETVITDIKRRKPGFCFSMEITAWVHANFLVSVKLAWMNNNS